MAGDDGSAGCGCIIIFIVLCVIGGGFWQGVGLAGLGWLGWLVFVGVSIGIVAFIVKAIAGD
jgi:hypothetical protein